jgi:hypothetical protein
MELSATDLLDAKLGTVAAEPADGGGDDDEDDGRQASEGSEGYHAAAASARIDLPLSLLGTVLPYYKDSEGEQYVTASVASIPLGVTRRRLQQLGPELGGRKAEEVFPLVPDRVQRGLEPDQWLFPVDRVLKPRR